MIVESLALENFMGYRDRVDLDLSNKRTIGIIGPNESGKSTLFQAIRYSLYGRSAADRENQLIHGDANGHLIVECSFSFGNGPKLNITRGRTKKGEPILKVSGINGSPSQLQQTINERLKLCHEDFVALTYFVQKDIDQFMTGNKRSFFQRWTTNLRVWDEMHGEAKEKLATLESKRTKLFASIEHYKKSADKLDGILTDLDKSTQAIKSINKNIVLTKEAAAKLKRKAERRFKIAELAKLLNQEKADLKQASKLLEGSQRLLKRIRSEFKSINKGRCPVLNIACKQLKQHDDDLIATLKAQLQSPLEQVRHWTDRKEQLEKSAAVLKKDIKTLEKNDVADEYHATQNHLADLERQLKQLLIKHGRLKASRKHSENAKRQIESANVKLQSLDKKIKAVNFVSYMCGNSGVPAVLIEQELEHVERKCNWVLERLDYQKRISFSPHRVLGGYEKLCPKCGNATWMKGKCISCGMARPHKLRNEPTVVIIDQGIERPFALESGGAQTLQSFAVRLACSLFVGAMMGVSLDMVMLDEIFAHLDAENRQRLLHLIIDKLATEFGLKQQLIVSHHDDIINAVDDIVLVRKKRNASTAGWL